MQFAYAAQQVIRIWSVSRYSHINSFIEVAFSPAGYRKAHTVSYLKSLMWRRGILISKSPLKIKYPCQTHLHSVKKKEKQRHQRRGLNRISCLMGLHVAIPKWYQAGCSFWILVRVERQFMMLASYLNLKPQGFNDYMSLTIFSRSSAVTSLYKASTVSKSSEDAWEEVWLAAQLLTQWPVFRSIWRVPQA